MTRPASKTKKAILTEPNSSCHLARNIFIISNPTMPSPLKGKRKSQGVPHTLKKLLAKDIEAAGGPFVFTQGEKPGLESILKREPYQQHLTFINNNKKSVRNLVDSWKNKKYYKDTEDWLAKVYIPVVLRNTEETCQATSNIDSDTETEDEDEAYCNPPVDSQKKKMTNKPTQHNKIGDRIVAPLSRGLILVIYWVDSKLSNLDVRVSADGLSVLYRTKMSHPKTASELLSHYSWGSDPTNMAVGALDTLLASDELRPAPESTEWSDAEVIVALDEPVVRTFVDIKGNETGHIGHKSDHAGRQTITFLLKTESSNRVAPTAGIFTNNGPKSGDHDMYDEETVADSKISELEAKLAEQANQMSELSGMMMKFMEMQMKGMPS